MPDPLVDQWIARVVVDDRRRSQVLEGKVAREERSRTCEDQLLLEQANRAELAGELGARAEREREVEPVAQQALAQLVLRAIPDLDSRRAVQPGEPSDQPREHRAREAEVET